MGAQWVLEFGTASTGPHQVLLWVLDTRSLVRQARAHLRESLQRSGVNGDALGEAELAVAELATNAKLHARSPFELRVIVTGGVPVWCEIADGDPDPGNIPAVLERLRTARTPGDGIEDLVAQATMIQEGGRGLLLVHHLSDGHCCVYPTLLLSTGAIGKAVAFSLPAPAPVAVG